MARTIDVVGIVLLAAAAVGFSLGVLALDDGRDLHALYWLVVGALVLRSSTLLLGPGGK